MKKLIKQQERWIVKRERGKRSLSGGSMKGNLEREG